MLVMLLLWFAACACQIDYGSSCITHGRRARSCTHTCTHAPHTHHMTNDSHTLYACLLWCCDTTVHMHDRSIMVCLCTWAPTTSPPPCTRSTRRHNRPLRRRRRARTARASAPTACSHHFHLNMRNRLILILCSYVVPMLCCVCALKQQARAPPPHPHASSPVHTHCVVITMISLHIIYVIAYRASIYIEFITCTSRPVHEYSGRCITLTTATERVFEVCVRTRMSDKFRVKCDFTYTFSFNFFFLIPIPT